MLTDIRDIRKSHLLSKAERFEWVALNDWHPGGDLTPEEVHADKLRLALEVLERVLRDPRAYRLAGWTEKMVAKRQAEIPELKERISRVSDSARLHKTVEFRKAHEPTHSRPKL